LSAYVNDRVLPPATVSVRLPGRPLPNVIRGVFPLGPKRVSLSLLFSPEISAEWRDIQKQFLDEILSAVQLPIELADSAHADSHIVVFFFKQGRTPADTPKLMSQFRELPNRAELFSEDMSFLYHSLVVSDCMTPALLSPDASLSRLTILIPVDPITGVPIPNSNSCVTTGLIKAFGVGVLREDSISQADHCTECLAIDIRMAAILHKNNDSDRTLITPKEMVRRLSGGRCSAD
jgi:hypothetical protein